MKYTRKILPIIVISQFCCTSLWFAGNAVMSDLILNFNLQSNALGQLTSAVQLGFISGTLLFAILTIADRFAPSRVFFTCALIGALFNAGIIWNNNTLTTLLILRFFTGFFLAGIYPVGMKIAADFFEKGLGKSLSLLVAALTIGTAFPHLTKEISNSLPWYYVILFTSFLAILGGFLMFFLVPNGPFRKEAQQVKLFAFLDVFKNRKFRSIAFGYFGHMWELYAFWAFIPLILNTYKSFHSHATFNIPLWSFLIIAAGCLGCIVCGTLTKYIKTKKMTSIILLLSCICCLISPIMFSTNSSSLFLSFLLFWGMVVVADSPLFSTLAAKNTSAKLTGTALTIINSIGFLVTILSIQLLSFLQNNYNPTNVYVVLAIGPILGLIALNKKATQ